MWQVWSSVNVCLNQIYFLNATEQHKMLLPRIYKIMNEYIRYSKINLAKTKIIYNHLVEEEEDRIGK